MFFDSEDDRRFHDPQPAGSHRGVDARGKNGLAGVVLEFIKGRGRDPGMREINHDLIPWQLGDGPAADDVEGPEVGVRHNAPNVDFGCLLDGVYSDDYFDPQVPVGPVGKIRAGLVVLGMVHGATELPCSPLAD